jgi:ABC-2 type transport system permease protein
MDIINSAYQNTSSSVFIAKWSKHIQEILISPLTHLEIAVGYIIGGIVRSFFVSLCIYLIAGFFGGYTIKHPFLFMYFFLTIAIGFSGIGIIIALWSDDWEQLSILTSYLLTPLTFLGGVFYSLSMLPAFLKTITLFNPLFYLIDGFRYSMIGTLEGNLVISMTLAVVFAIVTTIYTTHMLKSGYKLRP